MIFAITKWNSLILYTYYYVLICKLAAFHSLDNENTIAETVTDGTMNNTPNTFLDNNSFENFDDTTTRRLKHPVITFFHLIFRSLALIGKRKYHNLCENNCSKCFSLFTMWMVFRQFHWKFCLHHSSLVIGFLDC